MSISKRKSIVLSIFMVCEIYLQSQYFLVVLVWKRLIEENCRRMYLSKNTYIKNWIRYTCSTEYILQCLYNINLSFVKLDNLFLKHMKIHVLIYKNTVHWSICFKSNGELQLHLSLNVSREIPGFIHGIKVISSQAVLFTLWKYQKYMPLWRQAMHCMECPGLKKIPKAFRPPPPP